jgi:hypothetical protein
MRLQNKRYPPFTDYHGINRTPICCLIIDLDLRDFEGGGSSNKEKLLGRASNKTLEKIKESMMGNQPCYEQVMVITYTNLLANSF